MRKSISQFCEVVIPAALKDVCEPLRNLSGERAQADDQPELPLTPAEVAAVIGRQEKAMERWRPVCDQPIAKAALAALWSEQLGRKVED